MPNKAEVHFNGRSVSGAKRAVRVGAHARVWIIDSIGIDGHTVYCYVAHPCISDISEGHSSEIP